GVMRRSVVARLGVVGGGVVPDEALVDGLWGEEWSRDRGHNLHAHVYALRRRLAAANPRGASWVARSGGGYRLVLADDEVDAGLFRSLAAGGRRAFGAGKVAEADGLFERALGLWRGGGGAGVGGVGVGPAGGWGAGAGLRGGWG